MDPKSTVNMSMMGRSLFCCDEAHIGTIGIKEIAPMARLLLAALALFFASPALAETITGQATVIDGDTLEIHGQRIRLSGIDAPESSQLCRGDDSLQYRCGAKAANELAEHVAGRPVSCEGVGRDQYGRAVAVCSIDGEDVAFWVVRNGLAFDWPRILKGPICWRSEGSGARGPWCLGGELCRAVGLSGVHQEWRAASGCSGSGLPASGVTAGQQYHYRPA
jgi:endonuclease YncB( thermonuclease family)